MAPLAGAPSYRRHVEPQQQSQTMACHLGPDSAPALLSPLIVTTDNQQLMRAEISSWSTQDHPKFPRQGYAEEQGSIVLTFWDLKAVQCQKVWAARHSKFVHCRRVGRQCTVLRTINPLPRRVVRVQAYSTSVSQCSAAAAAPSQGHTFVATCQPSRRGSK